MVYRQPFVAPLIFRVRPPTALQRQWFQSTQELYILYRSRRKKFIQLFSPVPFSTSQIHPAHNEWLNHEASRPQSSLKCWTNNGPLHPNSLTPFLPSPRNHSPLDRQNQKDDPLTLCPLYNVEDRAKKMSWGSPRTSFQSIIVIVSSPILVSAASFGLALHLHIARAIGVFVWLSLPALLLVTLPGLGGIPEVLATGWGTGS